jgi:transcriptional regulator with XRE-family HTH domain/Tfp pilus assembly protein PilF
VPSITLGQRLRKARLRMGLTQRELADGLVSPAMIRQIEQDRVFPTPEVLNALLVRLQLDDENLLHDLCSQHESKRRLKQPRSLTARAEIREAVPLYRIGTQRSAYAEQTDFTDEEIIRRILLYGLDSAVQTHDLSIRAAGVSRTISPLVERLYQFGQLWARKGDLGRARNMWQLARRLTTMHPSVRFPQRFRLLADLGKAHLICHDYAMAIRCYREALAAARNDADRALVYHGAANALLGLTNYAEAEAAYREAMELYKRTNQLQGVHQCRTSLGVLLRKSGLHDNAADWFRSLLRDPLYMRDPSRLAHATGELALCLHAMGDISQAEHLLRKGLGTAGVNAEVRAFLLQALLCIQIEHGQLESATRMAALFLAEDVPTAEMGVKLEIVVACGRCMRSEITMEELNVWISRWLFPEQ